MMTAATYPIGIHGTPWGEAELDTWRERRMPLRSYAKEVLPRIDFLSDQFDIETYGELNYADDRYRLYALRSRDWNPALPVALVTGGVHGYETSGVTGALAFLEAQAARYAGRVNLIVVPCVSPWGYERINRWNYDALDPNRNFRPNGPAQESSALVKLLTPLHGQVLMHIDLHETTDSDESEFRPALAARDGKDYEPDEIPDGFYLVDDSDNPQPAFQQAIITAVEAVTHIAPPDAHGNIIGSPLVAHGVIEYPVAKYAMCTGITGAPYTTTTEVYPDSPRASPQECSDAQVAAVCAAIDYVLTQV
ncbi:M14 family metallocarboxypeptidase [Asticcacaulis sp. MM231]|uniref:M14 family metallopeptidase n=1 Tax=Asticcacaulis sp. MM231 TaxID=3157666 RepID=UPI0032D58457